LVKSERLLINNARKKCTICGNKYDISGSIKTIVKTIMCMKCKKKKQYDTNRKAREAKKK